jgi:type IVB pilus formation R64 PilN family outer membrane protein
MTVALHLKQGLLIVSCLIGISACSTKYFKPTSSYSKETGMGGASNLMMDRLPADNENIRGGRDFNEKAAKEQAKGEVFRKATQPWIGAKAIPVREGERLPDAFYEKIVFNHSDIDASWTLDILANRLSKMTKMPVRISPDAYTSLREKMGQQDNTDVATEVNETPPEVAPVLEDDDAPEVAKPKVEARSMVKLTENAQQKITFAPALLKWNGSLKGFLTHISDRLDLNWTYQDGGIVFSRYVVETFEVAQFPFDSAYKISSGATGGAGKGGAASKSGAQATPSLEMKFSEEGNLVYFNSTIKILRSMIASAPGSELFISDATGKVVVKSSRFILSQIRDFLRTENASMMRQVVIQVDIYSINTNDSNQFSVDLSSAYQKIFSGLNGGFTSTQSVVDANVPSMTSFQLSKGSTVPATVVIESLRSEGFSVQHRPVSLVAMNRQWARKSRLAVTNYLSETTPAAGVAGVGCGSG